MLSPQSRMLARLLSLALVLSAPLPTWSNPHGHLGRNAEPEIAPRNTVYSNSSWTYYNVGLGACGVINVASDFVVALNINQYGSGYPGPNCFKQISMTYNGKTTTATITDECVTCSDEGLDLSVGLFEFFAPLDAGLIHGTWSFV
ncbi:hypothetical protein H0H93_001655 [Arthromyces matolae]|nr:hypothetical protein H0H93_001655 [Arthromyces matolae]